MGLLIIWNSSLPKWQYSDPTLLNFSLSLIATTKIHKDHIHRRIIVTMAKELKLYGKKDQTGH